MAEFVNLYAKAFMFLQNILLENISPFEEHTIFIHSYMFRWIVKFGIDITELSKESSHFLKSVTFIVILDSLVHTVAKMYKSQYVKKLVMFRVAVKNGVWKCPKID
jgi:hypothetical protein